MSKLIIIRGNSGSGKTTLARALQHKFGRNTMVISQDMVRRDMLWVKDGKETEALPLLQNLLKYGKEHSDIVILEGILYADWYEKLFQTAVKEFSPEIFAYYYELPFEETLHRHQSKPNCHEFGEDAMRRWWREKDYIGFIPEKFLSAEISLEDALAMIYQEINSFS